MVYITAATPRGQIDQYARLMREIGQTHVRGIAFALNGVGKDAQARINAGLASVIDQPNAFTQRALAVRLIPLSTQTLANVSSDVHVLPAQSAYLKYLLGDGSSVRSPGDVGPADEHIYVPLWRTLARVGIRPLNGGSLPRSTLKRLLAGKKAPKGKRKAAGGNGAYRGSGGFFFGRPTFGGVQHGQGIYLRPTRARVDGHVVNSGRPLMLVRAVQRATYRPILRPLWDKSTTAAMATLGDRLERELQDKLTHLGRDGVDPFRRWNGSDFLKAR